MSHPAVPRLPVPPGPAGVAAVAGAVRRLLAGASGSVHLGPPGGAPPTQRPPAPPPDAAESDGPVVIVGTSGSSGTPQQVVLPWAALLASADVGAAALGEPGRWLTAIPVTGVGGLLTVVRSIRAGHSPTPWPGVGGAAPFTAASFAAAARDTVRSAVGAPAYCSLVPTQLHRVLADPEATAALAHFEAVLVGGAALAPALHARARSQGVRVISTYGATETAGGVVYDGRPLPGVSVDIVAGLIEIGGPTVAAGYLSGDPEGRFRAGRFRTLDEGSVAAGRLVVTGRADQTIKVGGEKVSLAAVTAVLMSDPDVLDATTVARPDDEWGQVPHCYVVARAGVAGVPDRLGALVEARLGRRARPLTMTLVPELPVTPAGKPVLRDL